MRGFFFPPNKVIQRPSDNDVFLYDEDSSFKSLYIIPQGYPPPVTYINQIYSSMLTSIINNPGGVFCCGFHSLSSETWLHHLHVILNLMYKYFHIKVATSIIQTFKCFNPILVFSQGKCKNLFEITVFASPSTCQQLWR